MSIIQVGTTTDNKVVVKDIAKQYFQQGLPLSFVFDILQTNNMVPDWIALYQEMKDNGMTHKRIIHLLHEMVFESYGKEFRDVIIKRLEFLCGSICR